MELNERMNALKSSAESQLHALNSRKRTENALILPFFRALGYDPFDVRGVEPDFDVGLEEQGVKTVDYALKKNGEPVMLFQCEKAEANLGRDDNFFLAQSFDALSADIAVVTNGLRYRFYANLDSGIRVGGRPFLKFDLLKHKPEKVGKLGPLTKSRFDTGQILSAAYERICGRLLRTYFAEQRQSPDDPFVRFMASQIYEDEVSDDVLERVRPVVQAVLTELVEVEQDVLQQDVQQEGSNRAVEGPGSALVESDSNEEDQEVELSSSEESTPDEKGWELDGEDPFDKDLAKRVIDEF